MNAGHPYTTNYKKKDKEIAARLRGYDMDIILKDLTKWLFAYQGYIMCTFNGITRNLNPNHVYWG